MEISLLFSMAGFALAMSISPGPVNLVALGTGARYGFPASLRHVVGATLGFILLLLLMGLGLGGALSRWPLVAGVLHWGGVLFLCYLAWQLLVDSGRVEGVDGGPPGETLINITNGNGTSQVMYIWEHCRHAGCATNGTSPPGLPPNMPWPIDDSDAVNHYPEPRHMGVYNVLFCDGHVVAMRKSELTRPMYYVR